MNWTDAQVERLRELWVADEGSAAVIAAQLGKNISRNAVIGKANRIGLTKTRRVSGAETVVRAKKVKPRSAPIRLTPFRPRAVEPPLAAIEAIPEPAVNPWDDDHFIPIGQRRTLIELQFGDCRWPVGDPGTPDFFFCGATTSRTYCATHARRAFVPQMRRARQ